MDALGENDRRDPASARSRTLELVPLRVAQETLNNPLKHSEANLIWIALDCLDDSLVLRVGDIGRGLFAVQGGG